MPVGLQVTVYYSDLQIQFQYFNDRKKKLHYICIKNVHILGHQVLHSAQKAPRTIKRILTNLDTFILNYSEEKLAVEQYFLNYVSFWKVPVNLLPWQYSFDAES